jgi:hypothetical protein
MTTTNLDIDNITIKQANETNTPIIDNPITTKTKVYKTPSYTRRAIDNYMTKLKSDPEKYKEMMKEKWQREKAKRDEDPDKHKLASKQKYFNQKQKKEANKQQNQSESN